MISKTNSILESKDISKDISKVSNKKEKNKEKKKKENKENNINLPNKEIDIETITVEEFLEEGSFIDIDIDNF